MKVISHKPKSKWHPPTFTIRGISRDTLSLLLTFAEEGVEKTDNPHVYESTLKLAKAVRTYIDSEACVRMTPLELPNDVVPDDVPLEEDDDDDD